jgi:hypothetical protein
MHVVELSLEMRENTLQTPIFWFLCRRESHPHLLDIGLTKEEGEEGRRGVRNLEIKIKTRNKPTNSP